MILDIAVLATALLWDICLGEPERELHPVCWMGAIIESFWKRRPVDRLFSYGCTAVLIGTSFVLAWGMAVEALPMVVSFPLSVWFLKGTFSVTGLMDAGESVRRALEFGRLESARSILSYNLVSRDTSALSGSDVAGAAIESLAENFGDGLVAPLFFFGLCGLPGALVYRFVNTCDSMLGYREGDFELGGKFAARFDDVLNWVPARLSSVLLLAGAALTGADWRGGFSSLMRDHAGTSSPNAGWPMAAMAGSLSVVLDKKGVYRLNSGGKAPGAEDLKKAMDILGISQFLSFSLLFLCIWAIML